MTKNEQKEFESYLDEYEQGLEPGSRHYEAQRVSGKFPCGAAELVLPDLVIGLVLTGIALMNFMNMLVSKQ